jgi:hypothetical protein
LVVVDVKNTKKWMVVVIDVKNTKNKW